jgi:peptidoglycan/LPS O-acetylase OafA/YrhL
VRDQRASATGFRADIEGLRAVAVLAVVLFHAAVPGVTGGYVGVDVFFVISGFLITGLLQREVSASGSIRLPRFYGARARRLLPASAVVGIATVIGSAILLPPLQSRGVIIDGIASALYVGNYRFASQGVDYLSADVPPSPFQHYWSLGVEEQFYLVWPPLIIAVAWLARHAGRRFGTRATSSGSWYLVALAVIGAASFVMSLVATHEAPSWAFFSLPTRAWELAVGGLVALTASAWRRLPMLGATFAGWAGLVLVLGTCVRLGTNTPYPGTAALFPVLGAAMVIGAGCNAPALGCGRVLAVAPMRAIGRVSYSWYLWHWPVLLLAPPLLGHPLGLAGRLLAAALSGGLAVLTLYLIENPVRFANPVRRSAGVSLLLGGVATACAVCTGVALLVLIPLPVGHGAPVAPLTITATPPTASQDIGLYDAAVQRAFAQVQAAVTASADLKAVPSNLDPPLAEATNRAAVLINGCLREYLDVGQPECATGDTASTTTVALVGDSHAAMWYPAFQQVADNQRWRLEMLGRVACPPMALRITSATLHREYTECEQWREQIMARLQLEHPRLVVLGMSRAYGSGFGFTSFDPSWIDSLTRLITRLRATGAEVLVLGPTPNMGLTVPTCLSGHLDDATACSRQRSAVVNETGIAAETAATKAGGGQYVDLTPLFCTADRCPVIIGNTLVYRDLNHVTVEYARVLAPVMGALAARALAPNR